MPKNAPQNTETIAHSTPVPDYRVAELGYKDAVIDARSYSPDLLNDLIDSCTATIADPDPDYPGPVGRLLARARRAAFVAELERRERLARIDAGIASPRDARYEARRELARLIRAQVDIVEIFRSAGYLLLYCGYNQRRQTEEYAGACLLCGGEDRLRVWSGPNGRAWCRQCAWSGDVITVARSLHPEWRAWPDALNALKDLIVPRGVE